MANRTAKEATTVKGTNPQFLVEKIIRSRIYESRFWKEECFALSAELLVDKAMALDHVGGVFGGNTKVTPFLCLILKMLQIQPEKDIVVEFIKNEDYKYVRCLGAMYLRLVGTALDCYKYLEPLYNDYRKLKRKTTTGSFELIHVDEYIDELLHQDRVCDVILPRIQKRQILEQCEQLEARVSALDDDLYDVDDAELEELERELQQQSSPRRSPSPLRRDRDRDRDRGRDRDRERHRSPSPRRRSRSPDYHRRRHSPVSRSRRRSRSRSPRRRRDHDDRRDRDRDRYDDRYDDDRRHRRDRDHHRDRDYDHNRDRDYDRRHRDDRDRDHRDDRDRDHRDHRRR